MSGLIGSTGAKSGFIGQGRPAWNVSVSSNYSHTSSNIVQFANKSSSQLFSNPDSAFDTSGYKYTAPLSGTYMLYCQIIFQSVDSGSSMVDSFLFLQNGTNVGHSWRRAFFVEDHTGDGQYFTDSGSTTVEAVAGDYFQIKGQRTEEIHANHQYTMFTGHLI